ncbi:OTU domain-containing protein 1 [Boleophthalmus pectinirostris]|uniref:OTU domain-containing protein 1 n=1 Tax=Boleophthalmus pectinirostris TaxID=150288 RepID=UPI000A1C47F3|nr:OTU domain-containing protein 1 [Boleophthalmus pectinirostris]
MLLSSFRNSPAEAFAIKESDKMQLYNSVLTHYPKSTRKVTITLRTAPERQIGNTSTSFGSSGQSSQPNSSSTTNGEQLQEGASSANMPAFSCYEASSMRPIYYTSTAEILIRRADGVERSVPIHIVRESKAKSRSPSPVEHNDSVYRDSDVFEDLIDHLRNGFESDQLNRNALFNSNVCQPITEEQKMCRPNDSEIKGPLRSNGWASVHEEELRTFRPEEPDEVLTQEVSGDQSQAEADKGQFELSVLQEAPSHKGDINAKVQRYLAEVERQNKYLEERHKFRYHIIPDGNCLYRAVCKAVYGDQARHKELREQTVHHIADHLDEFNPIIEGDVCEFLINAAQDGAWAGYPELLAMSQMLKVNIQLTTGGSLESPTVSTMLHYLGEEDVDKPEIWLSWLSNGHYDALLDKCVPNPEYEEWCRHSQMQRKRDEELAKSMAVSLSKMYIEQNGDSGK